MSHNQEEKVHTIKECSAFPLEVLKTKEEAKAKREEKRRKWKNTKTIYIKDMEDNMDDNLEEVPTIMKDLMAE